MMSRGGIAFLVAAAAVAACPRIVSAQRVQTDAAFTFANQQLNATLIGVPLGYYPQHTTSGTWYVPGYVAPTSVFPSASSPCTNEPATRDGSPWPSCERWASSASSTTTPRSEWRC